MRCPADMLWFLLSLTIIAGLTVGTARLIVARRPTLSPRAQTFRAAMAAPVAGILLFALMTIVTLIDARHVQEPGGTAGMAIFAMVFFLFYWLVLSAAIGIPAAIIALRRFRRG